MNKLMYMNVSRDKETGEWSKSYCVEGNPVQAAKRYPISAKNGETASMWAYSFCETSYNPETKEFDGPVKASYGIMVGQLANQFKEDYKGLCIVCFQPNGNDGIKPICNKEECFKFLQEILS